METQLLLAARLDYLKQDSLKVVLALRAEVECMLDSLIRTLKAKTNAKP